MAAATATSTLCMGLCCKNSAAGLNAVLNNLKAITSCFQETVIIFCYDQSTDNTLSLLQTFQQDMVAATLRTLVVILSNAKGLTRCRTENIANARNTILQHVRSNYAHFDYLAMMDANEYSCVGEINTQVLTNVFNPALIGSWDAVSFDREAGYYDHWALSIPNFIYSFFHCSDWRRVVANMRRDFNTLLADAKLNRPNMLIPVYSAFNGFALYKMSKFIDSHYSSRINILLFPADEMHKQATYNGCRFINKLENDCEHRAFHLEATKKHGSRIRIFPQPLFKKIPEAAAANLRGPA